MSPHASVRILLVVAAVAGCKHRADKPPDAATTAGAPCQVGVGACRVEGLLVALAGGVTCDATPKTPALEERCDLGLVDEDCDGLVNEGCACIPGLSPEMPCGSQIGECRRGRLRCVDGVFETICQDAIGSAPEVCDEKDNDCNSIVDDVEGGCSNVVGTACEVGVGACRAEGTLVASDGGTKCNAVPKEPTVEVCDGKDNDCDGLVDDIVGGCSIAGTPCQVGEGACRATGTLVVSDGGVTCNAIAKQPTPEVCDGDDNDCDGLVDEVVGGCSVAVGGPCEVGVGACRAEGTLIRSDGGVTCNATPKAPQTEKCDLGFVDENCNGVVNEGCACIPGLSPDLPCGSAVGECRPGHLRCADGAYGPTCLDAVTAVPEVCDGKDNDCNGMVDDVAGGCRGATCAPTVLQFKVRPEPESYLHCGPPQCEVDGTVPSLAFCCQPGSWTQCPFSSFNLNSFDADHRGEGVLEVRYCLSERVSNLHLTLYYGKHPFRKGVPLLTEGERRGGLGPGCFVRYFSPEDAQCAAYNAPPTSDFPPNCVRSNSAPLWPCHGKWSSLAPECGMAPFDYDNVPVWLTAEYCRTTVNAVVSIKSLRLLGEGCKCAMSGDCTSHGWARCALAATTASFCPADGPRCAGVCTDVDISGSP